MPARGRSRLVILPESTSVAAAPDRPARVAPRTVPPVAVEAASVSRSFGRRLALDRVSLRVRTGEIHALLGPNGAGKTTLLRIVAGLTAPQGGSVTVLGADVSIGNRALRQQFGLVPSGDRSFYLRISGLENLAFFARLHGLRRRDAVARSREVLELVGLLDAARVRVGEYSHGMQKRLSVARALLTEPAVLLVDEATHDLDPDGARIVRQLVGGLAHAGAAILWATQRIDEIRGFADKVTVLQGGAVRFHGSVPELLAHGAPRTYLVLLANGGGAEPSEDALREALARRGTARRATDEASGHFVLSLADGVVLGDAVADLSAAGIKVLSCAEERSGIEEAFLTLTGGTS
jgi:ABC-2 type transport system ATP-binding protein